MDTTSWVNRVGRQAYSSMNALDRIRKRKITGLACVPALD